MSARNCPADLKIVTNWKNALTPFCATELLPGAFFGSSLPLQLPAMAGNLPQLSNMLQISFLPPVVYQS